MRAPKLKTFTSNEERLMELDEKCNILAMKFTIFVMAGMFPASNPMLAEQTANEFMEAVQTVVETTLSSVEAPDELR